MPTMDDIRETPVKRRKIATGDLTRGKGDTSGDDSEDDLFEDYETIDTVPVLLPKNHIGYQTEPFTTQSTQPWNIQKSVPRETIPSVVQVAGSSPSQSAKPKPLPTPSNATGGILASAMAPPGTAFRLPHGASNRTASPKIDSILRIELSDDDDHPPHYCGGSSDEDIPTARRDDIKPSSFTSAHLPDLDRFRNVTTSSIYRPDASRESSAADEMANIYGARKRDRPPQPLQKPTLATAHTSRDLDLSSVEDYNIRKKVERLRAVLPQCSVNMCLNALVKKKGIFEDAMDLLASQEEHPYNPIDLTGSDNEKCTVNRVSAQPMPRKTAAKQQIKAPNLSIQEKWTATQTLPKTIQVSPVHKPDFIDSHRRRLVQGSRHDSSVISTTAKISSPISSPQPVASNGDASDSGLGSDIEEVRLDERLLQFLNSCSPHDLVDMAAVPLETATSLLSQRPFSSLRKIRQLTGTSGQSKNLKKPIGDRIVDKCLEMWSGYEAVDRLVCTCEELGKSVYKDIQRWGLDLLGCSNQGELEMVDLDATSVILRDSGLGTPTSRELTEDEGHEGQSPSIVPSKRRGLYCQPSIMADGVVLKDYQIVGMNWLALLFDKRLSCILADDMGLGKTCQVVAFFALLLEVKKVIGPHLVIVPASTLENWLREFRQFCPKLNVMPYYAAEKDRAEIRDQILVNRNSINAIVTTYTVAKSQVDNKFLRQLKPICVVYDEGHTLKNSKSAGYGAYMKIPSDFRLLLTGTPLQNNLKELASLLGFILPSLFREHSESLEAIFSHKAKTTDSNESHAALLSDERIKRAKTMMTPFVLRRKKHQVLKYLPQKHRNVQYCELLPSQKSIYQEKKARALDVINRREAGLKVGNETTNVMMDLRKASIHPLLFRRHYDQKKLVKMSKACLKEDEFHASDVNLVYEDMEVMTDMELHQFCDRYPKTMASFRLENEEWMDSGKVVVLAELLQRYKRNGDRILIFSQFVMVLNILEAVMETLDMQFFRLDGGTKIEERQDMIDQFYKEPEITVFLLSTGAGGAGINLACANKVIIFDSSFNPQSDIQAENRAHRVGQTREVEVVRLVTKGTIEEQIHALGETKLILDDRVAGVVDDEAKVEKQAVTMVAEMMVGESNDTRKMSTDRVGR